MSDRVKVLSVFGTRPEAIKLAPLLLKMANQPERFTSVVCATGQHDRMLRQALDAFQISPDYNLDVMTANQRLSELTAKLVVGLEKVIAEVQPSVVLVHGDTTTTFSAALAAFYARVPVSHVEAGLRSWDRENPFPEETNRVLTDRLSSFFFAPTELNRGNLLDEGVSPERIFVTGNTAIDALLMMRDRVAGADPDSWIDAWGSARQVIADRARPLILVTAHRRESFGGPFREMCAALNELATEHPAWSFVYPVHLNPNVQDTVNATLGGAENIHLIQPLDYDAFVYLMNRACLILTDSGGIQEEAPSLQKPVVVMREKTERTEAIEAGTAILVGTNRQHIKDAVEKLMTDQTLYEEIAGRNNPYGDGFASDRILDQLYESLRADRLELCDSVASYRDLDFMKFTKISAEARRLCLISHGQPAANPRLVRDANALAEAGYDVRVVTAQYNAKLIPHDRMLADRARWRYEPVDLLKNGGWPRHWDYLRTRKRISAGLANWLLTDGLVARGYAYGNPEVAKIAARQPADLYVAYQQTSLPAAAWAAQKNNAIFAVDAQDLLADCSAEPTKLAVHLERRYLQDCAYISTMSASAAERLRETNKLSVTPIVLHNTPSLVERERVPPPADRQPSDSASIYWFGQTIGPQSRAEQVLKAMPHLSSPVKLVLRGNPLENYVEELTATARALGVSSQLTILPRAEPTEMVRLAAAHDILLGTQPGAELFNQMAIGNKVFTGMMAGLALALSDTIAHRDLLAETPGCGFLFPDGDIHSLAVQLNELLGRRERLEQMKATSWDVAEKKFNWEEESKTLLVTVNSVCAGRSAAVGA